MQKKDAGLIGDQDCLQNTLSPELADGFDALGFAQP